MRTNTLGRLPYRVPAISSLLMVGLLTVPQGAFSEGLVDTLDVPLALSNECAIFYTPYEDSEGNVIKTLDYGELVVFDTRLSVNGILEVNDTGQLNLKFHVQGHGEGIGDESGMKYQFNLKSMLKANTALADLQPFTGNYALKAKIVGQGQPDPDGDGTLTGASNNADLNFTARIHYDGNGNLIADAYDWSIECAGSPRDNLMENWNADTRDPVERGFGDPWNKYAWSMANFGDNVYVGTKNAYYDILAPLNGEVPGFALCYATIPLTEVHKALGCLELFGDSDDRDSRGGQIWAFDTKKKRWSLLLHAGPDGNEYYQGFRDMVVHDGKLYVGGDLGSFLMGVSYVDPTSFPGMGLLVSEDGETFDEVEGCPTDIDEVDGSPTGLCGGAVNPLAPVIPPLTTAPFTLPDNNISIRALASYQGKIYIGTFNFFGGELWSYDGTDFALVHKFPAPFDLTDFSQNPLGTPLVAELTPYNGKLYIGIASGPDNLFHVYDGSTVKPVGYEFEEGSAECIADPNNQQCGDLVVIKLFAAKGKLLAGTTNFDQGFSLTYCDGTDEDFCTDGDNWQKIVGSEDGGFYNPDNAYAWSMAELGGRVFVGSFNVNFIDQIPRGESELWYSDDLENWTEFWLPLDWGFMNYGIRSMIATDKELFLGSASNMAAPDEFHPGTEVWKIRDAKLGVAGNSNGN